MVFFAALAAAAAAVAALVVRQLGARPDVPLRFAARAIAVAALHALLAAAVFRRWGIRGVSVYVAASAVVFAAAGGPRHAAALVVLAAAVPLLGAAGRRIGALFLPAASLSAGVCLGFGIAAVSWAISLALLAGVFGTPFLAGLGIAAVGLAVLPSSTRAGRADLSVVALAKVEASGEGGRGSGGMRFLLPLSTWRGGGGVRSAAIELAFLLGAAEAMRGTAPESGFDALTRYLPWLKIAARTGGFPKLPWQFPFVLPQAGLAWAAAFAFDPVAQRVAMLLALAVCAAIAGARCFRKDVAPGLAGLVALIVASCPLVLSAAHGLQPDPFAWLAVLLLAVAASDGDLRRSAFWPACGALFALAWCGKYSTAGFSAPLLLYAFWRAAKAEGRAKAIAKAAPGGAAGAVLAAGPWLLHAFRESRNPVFPLLSSIFPSPLWRMRIDSVWRGGFAFEPGARGWLFWPIDMTIHTNRFAEGRPGSFGLTLLAILVLGALSLRAADRAERVWLAAAAAGTLIVWTQTPLVRYWLPALWLAVPAASRGAEILAGWIGRRAAAAGFAAIVLLQTGFAAFSSKADLEGRRWAVYTGREAEAEYVARMPGASALARLAAIDPAFPKVWYSGLYAVGHADIVPLMAERWELAFHVRPDDRKALSRYIDSVGCRYWAVASALPDRAAFERLGIAERYWRPSAIVVQDAAATIYRIE